MSGGFSGQKPDRGFRHAEGFGEKLDEGLVGLALFGNGRNAGLEIGLARVIGFDAVDPVASA
ncbi:hypothetical protein D3C87_2060810 [compost metagenome]